MAAFTGMFRRSWYLAVLIVALLLAAAFLHSKSDAKTDEIDVAQVLPIKEAIITSKAEVKAHAIRKTQQETTQSTIDDMQAQFDANPQSEDAPALLNSMANLNRQKFGNYREAARLYELLLLDYPDWQFIKRVYSQLATCYEKIGDSESERDVYRRMMEKLPPDSQEYLYAKTQLGLQ